MATDSAEKAEAIAELLQVSHGEEILLTAKTVTDAWSKKFLADPNAYIRAQQPTWLIYSPKAESGVDISIMHKFSDMFCWFVGCIGVDEYLQMSSRVRHPQRITVFAVKRGLGSFKDGHTTYYKQISAARRVTAEAMTLTDEALSAVTREAIAQQTQSPHHETYCKIKAKENFERRDLWGYLFKAFEAGVYAPQWLQAGTWESNEHCEAKQECRDKTAKQIVAANDIALKEGLEIERRYSASWAERCQALKAWLKARPPGIERSAPWTWKFVRLVRFGNRALLSKLESSWLFKNQDISSMFADCGPASHPAQPSFVEISNRRITTTIGRMEVTDVRLETVTGRLLDDFVTSASTRSSDFSLANSRTWEYTDAAKSNNLDLLMFSIQLPIPNKYWRPKSNCCH